MIEWSLAQMLYYVYWATEDYVAQVKQWLEGNGLTPLR